MSEYIGTLKNKNQDTIYPRTMKEAIIDLGNIITADDSTPTDPALVNADLLNNQPASYYANRASVPTALSQLSSDSTHRVVTDAEKTAWNRKIDNTITVTVTRLEPGATPTVNYNSQTNVISFGIPAGADGITPTIGANGNWYLGSTDTGKPSRGAAGEQGAAGHTPVKGTDYWTAFDQQSIVNDVLAALPYYDGGVS